MPARGLTKFNSASLVTGKRLSEKWVLVRRGNLFSANQKIEQSIPG